MLHPLVCMWASRAFGLTGLLDGTGIGNDPREFREGRAAAAARRIYDELRRREHCSTLVLEGLTLELIHSETVDWIAWAKDKALLDGT